MVWYCRIAAYAFIVGISLCGCSSHNCVQITFPPAVDNSFLFSNTWNIVITDLQVAYSANNKTVLIGRGYCDVQRSVLHFVRLTTLMVVDIDGFTVPGWCAGEATVTVYVGGPVPDFYVTIKCHVYNEPGNSIVTIKSDGDVLVRYFPYVHAVLPGEGIGYKARPVEIDESPEPRRGQVELDVRLDIAETWATWLDINAMTINDDGDVFPKVAD